MITTLAVKQLYEMERFGQNVPQELREQEEDLRRATGG